MRLVLSFILLGFVLISTGCVRTPVYITNRQHVPLMKQKGDLSASINLNNAHLAYSPVQGLGIMVNGYHNKSSYKYTSNTWPVSDYEEEKRIRQVQSLAEIAAGYYLPFGADSSLRFEVYGGFGLGRASVNIAPLYDSLWSPRSMESTQSRFFIQPSIGFSKKYFEFALSCRLSGLQFSDVTFRNFTRNHIIGEGYSDLENKRHMFIEPAFTFRAGPSLFKFEHQVGFSHPTTYSGTENPKSYVRPRLFTSFAFHLRISTLGNK